MAARVAFTLRGAGVDELLHSDGVRADLARRADAVLSAAQSSAPVESGAYRAGLERVSATTDRAVERVAATVRHSLAVESRHGVLARALDAAGD